mgnify:CR=1 FL=1
MTYPNLDTKTLAALYIFRTQHGKGWRYALSNAWMRGSEPGSLQRLRNTHGPAWLATVIPLDGPDTYVAMTEAAMSLEHPAEVATALAHVMRFSDALELTQEQQDTLNSRAFAELHTERTAARTTGGKA